MACFPQPQTGETVAEERRKEQENEFSDLPTLLLSFLKLGENEIWIQNFIFLNKSLPSRNRLSIT